MQVTVFAQKGEQAKSTSAVNLMAASQDIIHDRHFRLADLDEQQRDSMRFVDGMEGVSFTTALPATDNDLYLTVVDTPPNVNASTMAALIKSDLIIIPCTPAQLSLEALARTFQTIKIIEEKRPDIQARVLFTRVDGRHYTQGMIAAVRALSEWPVLETSIPLRAAAFERAAAARKPIVTNAPKSAGAIAYRALAEEVRLLLKMKLKEKK